MKVKIAEKNKNEMKKKKKTTCSLRTTFPKKSSVPFSFLASLIILQVEKVTRFAWLPVGVFVYFIILTGIVPSQAIKVALNLLKFLTQGHFFVLIP